MAFLRYVDGDDNDGYDDDDEDEDDGLAGQRQLGRPSTSKHDDDDGYDDDDDGR